MNSFKNKLCILLSVLVVLGSLMIMPITANAADDNKSVSAEILTGQEDTEIPSETVTETETESVTETVTETETETVTETETETEPLPVVTKPDKVKGFSVKAKTDSSVSLKWKASNYAMGYLIQRAEETSSGKLGSYKTLTTVDAKYTSATNINLRAGTVYKYRIYAIRYEGGVTASSAATTLTVMTKAYPVLTFKVAKRTQTAIKLRWTKALNSSGYVLYRSYEKDGKLTEYKKYKKVKGTGFTDKNLKPATVYRYRVYSYRTALGLTTKSAGNAVKTVTVIPAPKKIVFSKSNTNAIKFKWSKVKNCKGFIVYRKENGSYKEIAKVKTNSYKDTSLSSGTTYAYVVRAYRVVSGKTYLGQLSSKLKATTEAGGIEGLKAKSYLSRVLFSWNSVSGAEGYDIFVKKSNGTWLYKDSTSYTNYLTGKLKLDKSYTYYIRAYYTSGGEKVYSRSSIKTVSATDTAYGQTVSGTWVEVCTETQTMYMYVNDKLYVTTPVVTGNYNSQDTTPGYHTVLSRQSPSELIGSAGDHTWDVWVDYWLAFTGDGQGIHDATWRSAFGGRIYMGDGSNGCVNTPYNAVKKIFAKAYVGMPVIVY